MASLSHMLVTTAAWLDRTPQSDLRVLGLHELDIESDRDLVTNQNAAGLESSVPVQAEVLTIDLCDGRDRNSRIAPRVLGRWRWPFNRKADLVGYAMDSQIALDRQLSIPDDADTFGFELQGREFLHIKEIGALQMSITL